MKRLTLTITFTVMMMWALGVVFITTGCSGFKHWYAEKVVGPEYQINYTDRAILCAHRAEKEGWPYEIWIGEVQGGERHAQVGAQVDGAWYWLTFTESMCVSPIYFPEENGPKFFKETMTQISLDQAIERWF